MSGMWRFVGDFLALSRLPSQIVKHEWSGDRAGPRDCPMGGRAGAHTVMQGTFRMTGGGMTVAEGFRRRRASRPAGGFLRRRHDRG